MRIESVARELEQSGTMQVSRATIKATPKIFDFFANQTYANKPIAIFRELVANAIDAHVAAGTPNRPVEVTLATDLDPTVRVRDFGTGMSHDFVMGPFMAYTDGSTKDGDNNAIGGFGIGSKSPFAYVDQFTLRVVHDGVLSVYTMFKDTDGVPAIGLQGQKTTDEHNGVEVSFPVEADDMETFRTAAQKALMYFRPLPLVSNGEINPPDYSYLGKNWGLRGEAGELGIIMGGVRYPVLKDSLTHDLRNDPKVSPLLGYGIDLVMPIGSASVALSREALSYDATTSANIKKALNDVIGDVVKTFSTMFDAEPTEWAARAKLYTETGMTQRYSMNPRQQLMASNAMYKGSKLETNLLVKGFVDSLGRAWLIESQNLYGGKSKALKSADWKAFSELNTLVPGLIGEVIIDDMPDSPKSKVIARVREYVETKGRQKQYLVLRRDDREYKTLLATLGNPVVVTTTSSMPEPASNIIQVNGVVKEARPKVRMYTFSGEKQRYSSHNITNLTPGHGKSVKEIPYKDQPTTGILVVMNSFDLPKDFYQQMGTGLISWSELHFVNGIDAPKLTQWKKFEDVFADRLKAALAANPNAGKQIAVYEAFLGLPGSLDRDFRYIVAGGLTLTPAQLKRPFGQLLTIYSKWAYPVIQQMSLLGLKPYVKVELPKDVNIGQLLNSMKATQRNLTTLLRIAQMDDLEQRELVTLIA
jgi:hypothetical protein